VSGSLTPAEWRALYRANEDGFWRLVRFEAEHEPDRLDYFAEVDRAEARRKSEERRRAVSLPPPRPGVLTFDDALERLENPRPAGRGRYTARCPVHEDRHASLILSMNEARPGEAVVHCFAGCDWRAIKDALKR
jgi:hypothetical protein